MLKCKTELSRIFLARKNLSGRKFNSYVYERSRLEIGEKQMSSASEEVRWPGGSTLEKQINLMMPKNYPRNWFQVDSILGETHPDTLEQWTH